MIHCGNPVAALMDYLTNHHPVVIFSRCDIVQRNRDIEHLHKDLYQLSCVAGGESVLNFQSIHQEIRSASPLQVLLEMASHSICCPC